MSEKVLYVGGIHSGQLCNERKIFEGYYLMAHFGRLFAVHKNMMDVNILDWLINKVINLQIEVDDINMEFKEYMEINE